MHVKPFLNWVGRYLCFNWSFPFFSSLSTSGSASGCSGTSTTWYEGSLYISTFKIIVGKAQRVVFVKFANFTNQMNSRALFARSGHLFYYRLIGNYFELVLKFTSISIFDTSGKLQISMHYRLDKITPFKEVC